MGTKPDKLERLGGRFAIDQQQIRTDVAFPVVDPIAGKGMIPVGRWQWLVVREQFKQRDQ